MRLQTRKILCGILFLLKTHLKFLLAKTVICKDSLIFYIENKSRALDVKQARIRRSKRQKELDNLIDSYNKRFLEEIRLNKVAFKALGFEVNPEHICTACGRMPTASGNCNC